MSIFYSASTGGFFDSSVHAADAIPDDAVELTSERHAELLAEQSVGLRIVPGQDGHPVAVPPMPK